jgi:DNA-binding response OmpR family regulator
MPPSNYDFYCPDHKSATVLIIEDDPSWGVVLAEALGIVPFKVSLAHTASDGFREAQSKHWDAIVIDLNSPSDSGFDLCRQLIDICAHPPILLVVQSRESLQYLLGFEMGAADCLYRPYDPRELAVRLKSVLRRGAKNTLAAPVLADAASRLTHHGLVIDSNRRMIALDAKLIDLTPQEFDLIRFMASHAGRVFSRSELLAKVWDDEYGGHDHTVDSHINRIRQKLGESSKCPRFIHTVWAKGYRFEAQATPQAPD